MTVRTVHVMLSAALSIDLATLGAGTDDPTTDIETALTSLATALTTTIDSYLGVSITTHASGQLVLITATTYPDDQQHAVATSLRIPLHLLAPGLSASGRSASDVSQAHVPVTGNTEQDAMTFYAERPGAFVDLAADLGFALGVPLHTLVLDAHSSTDLILNAPSGLSESSACNQAIGALVGQGRSVADAGEELAARALKSGKPVHAVARALLTDLTRRSDLPI